MLRRFLKPQFITQSRSIPKIFYNHAAFFSSTQTLSEKQYLVLVEDFLQNLSDHIDELMDADSNSIIEDVNYSSGVLKLDMTNGKTYVLNKQAPNKQLWLSSPFSGP